MGILKIEIVQSDNASNFSGKQTINMWQANPISIFLLASSLLVAGLSGLAFWRLYRHSTSPQRTQVAFTLMAGVLFPLLVFLVFQAGLNTFQGFDLMLLGTSLAGLLIAWALLRIFLDELLVIPRNKVVQDMPDAILVMDTADRLRDVNPAALKMIGLPKKDVLGQTLQGLRQNDAGELEILRKYQYTLQAQGEFSMGPPDQLKHFNFRLTPLYNFRNKLSGRLIVFRDVTELYGRELALKQANARLEDVNARLLTEMATRENVQNLAREQQRTLLSLDERERLGRELHDGLGQVLGFLGMEAQTAMGSLQNMDLTALQESLEKIASVSRDGHDDVRSFILGLRAATSRLSFQDGLGVILDQFRQRSGLSAQLDYPENAPEPAFEMEVELVALQFARIGLTNICKQARARHVSLKLEFIGGLARVELEQHGDGLGLEAPPAGPQLAHFGMTSLREQIEKIGGRFEVFNTPGQGTRLSAQLPCLGQAQDSEMDDLRTARGLRILLVDDHPLFLDGLRDLLKSRGLTVVGLARDGLEAQDLAEKLRPDVVVMDVNMPNCDGLEATRLIKQALPQTQVLILTVSEDEDNLYEAMKNGASGYLPKSLDLNEFVRLLASLSRGETPLTSGMALRLMRKFDRRGNAGPAHDKTIARPEALTDRQWLILQSVAQGQKYKQVAAQLSLSERTVKREMGQVLELLHIENRKDVFNYSRKTPVSA